MAEFGKFHAAYYWLLGRRNLDGIEIAARSEGTQSSAWRVGVILTVNKINRLGEEMGWMPLSPDGIAMCQACDVENTS